MTVKTKYINVFILIFIGLFLALSACPARNALADAPLSLEDIREEIRNNGYGFEVASNPVFEMDALARESLLGRRQPRMAKSDDLTTETWFEYDGLREDIPTHFDLRDVNGKSYIGPIHDQGDCGSCYAFAAAAAAEGVYNMAVGRTGADAADFSESFIAWHLGALDEYAPHFGGCDDADYTYSEVEALTREGVAWEKDFPYTIYDPGVYEHSGDPPVVFRSWGRIPSGDIDAIKAAILTYGAVVAAVYAGPAFLAYQSGIYEDENTECGGVPSYYTPTNHAVALVGWNDNGDPETEGYWILRNSWGAEWGENGFMRIKYRSARVSCAAAYLEPADWPAVETGGAVTVTAGAAVVSGTVNPLGLPTECWVEYGPGGYEHSSESVDAGSLEGRKSLSIELTGLDPQTTYHYRMAAYNGSEVNYGADRTFSTAGDPLAPGASTLAAENVMAHSAVMKGLIAPHGSDTRYQFEYGATTYYGFQTPWAPAGSGTDQAPASIVAGGLEPLTTYHFRIKAENSHGVMHGQDMVFTTDDSLKVWSQPPDVASTALHTSQLDVEYPFDARTADDFMFEADMGRLNKVQWWTRQLRADPVTPDSWRIFIHEDDGSGAPGPVAAQWTLPGDQCHESLYYRDKDIFQYWADLDGRFAPEAGVKYWLVIQAEVLWTPQVYWAASTGSVNLDSGISVFPELGIPDWTPHGPAVDHAFELYVDVTSSGNAVTGAAYEITDGSAHLTAAVMPPANGEVVFEYGLDLEYGGEVTADEYVVDKSGDGRSSRRQGVGAVLTGLAPSTTYHARVLVRSGDAVYAGNDIAFTTLAAPAAQTKSGAGQDAEASSDDGGGRGLSADGGSGSGCFISTLDPGPEAPARSLPRRAAAAAARLLRGPW